ncbi:hypothetical protein I8751_03120 [Nostocaceae cyanobacterium CENA357]|uniref:Uncharacterized protein n=1 Tax=Atlanticothrix silvestris CENA357 TaxID=1725252 RepID=A0A8J7HE04_9CYAN|nr:hypothetical protein [Atlanticothrix silvestris]MBH8551385.1 hypothetical protein [Atlanticothrix silvestris CENA357]
MAKIIISELHPVDSEIFLTDLNDDSKYIYGGENYAIDQSYYVAAKLFEAVISAFAIYSITWIVMSFNAE